MVTITAKRIRLVDGIETWDVMQSYPYSLTQCSNYLHCTQPCYQCGHQCIEFALFQWVVQGWGEERMCVCVCA
jgi:hypothetical protein